MWIVPQQVNASGTGDKWGKIDVTRSDDQKASETTIADGFSKFCSDTGGKSEIKPLKYGQKNVCTSATGEYLGEFDTTRYEAGLGVTFDSREYRKQQQIFRQTEEEAKTRKDYQKLTLDGLSIEQLQSLITRFQNNDPDHLIPHAKAKLDELTADRVRKMERANAENQQLYAEKHRHLENKHIGDQVCHFESGTSLDLPIGTVNGRSKFIGFVEDLSGKKIKIRISGIIFISYGITKSLDYFTNYKGGLKLEINSIIWDSIYDWDEC